MSRLLRRALAAIVIVAFALVVVGTTVASLGGYCLTSQGGDVRALPPPP